MMCASRQRCSSRHHEFSSTNISETHEACALILSTPIMFAARKVAPVLLQSTGSRLASAAAAAPTKDKYKVLVLGGGAFLSYVVWGSRVLRECVGSAGLAAAQQIYDRFASAGKSLNPQDIAIVDAAEWHHYQVRSYINTYAMLPAHISFHSQDGLSHDIYEYISRSAE